LVNFVVFLILCVSASFAQQLSPRTSNYTMDIKLDVDRKMLRAESIIEWTNPSDKPVSSLQFHLYYNAFKNSESTFMKDRNEFGFIVKNLERDCAWSYSEVISITDSADNQLQSGSRYIAPDDGNSADETVLLVPLVNAVQPGETATFRMEWKARIPKAMIRTGYNQDYYFFAQWFPKLGVYEPAGMRYEKEGAWNCHQYHASGEYYGEFGNYDVTLRVPKSFKVGASGSLVEEKEDGDEKSYRFKIDDVIDFTWTCSPHFKKIDRKWRDVDLQLFTYPGHEHFEDRYFNTAVQSLEYMDKHVGAYPYKSLTMVDPPIHGLFTGGMEYPTLISSISLCFFPSGVKAPETLIVHEFVHQYFMQMVATHEQEEPWMDEGITTYYEGRILDEYYGEKTSMFDTWGVQLGNKEYNRYEFWSSRNPKIADNSYKARDFIHGGYSEIAYNKTAMMLKTLEGILGLEKFDEVMKIYFEEWKFRHPCGSDFIEVFKNSLSETYLDSLSFNLDVFFEQALYGSVTCNYKVASIRNVLEQGKAGFLSNIDSCATMSATIPGRYKNQVILNRLGEMILPVDVLLTYEDGRTHSFVWDGKSRSTEFSEFSASKIIKVQLDPKRKLNLEKNFIDNTMVDDNSNAYRKYTSKFKVGMQHLLDFLNFLS